MKMIMANMHNVVVSLGGAIFNSDKCDIQAQITEDMHNKRACIVTIYNINKETENFFFEIGQNIKVAIEWINRNYSQEVFFNGQVFDSYKTRDNEGNVSFTILCDDGGRVAEQVNIKNVPKGSNMLSVVKDMVASVKGVTLSHTPPSLNAPHPSARPASYTGQIDNMIGDYLPAIYRVVYKDNTINIYEYNKGYGNSYSVSSDLFYGYPTRYVKTINNEPEDRDSKRKRYNISMLPFSWITRGNKISVTDSKQMPNTPHIIDSVSIELNKDTIRANIAVVEVDNVDNSTNNQITTNAKPAEEYIQEGNVSG